MKNKLGGKVCRGVCLKAKAKTSVGISGSVQIRNQRLILERLVMKKASERERGRFSVSMND